MEATVSTVQSDALIGPLSLGLDQNGASYVTQKKGSDRALCNSLVFVYGSQHLAAEFSICNGMGGCLFSVYDL